MSFTGGGSDLAVFYRKYGGAVLSTAIDKYVYVNVNKKFDDGIRIAYSKTEEVFRAEDVEHSIVRATLNHLKIKGGIEITTIADIPSKGTGLGSSSSFTVGLLNALNAYNGKYVSREQLGRDSCHIEINVCCEPIGKQDQYAAAFGGFNLIEFRTDDSVVVSPLVCSPATVETIERNILMFYTGITRSASNLLKQQQSIVANDCSKQKAMQRMVQLTYDLRDELQKDNHEAFGEILHESWILKKGLTSGISNVSIDECYENARSAGALGGKILGAGAGGFLMIYAPIQKHAAITHKLNSLRPTPVRFEKFGSQIIFYH